METFNIFLQYFISFFNYFILGFAVLIMSSYVILALISFKALREYLKENKTINYDVLLSSDIAPHISLIAPAYNEEVTIDENVESLLALNYPNFEVIIVNDGSKDETLEIIKKSYDLVKVDMKIDSDIETKEVRAIYKSTNLAFSNLIVVDKENGGKADALNVGINIAKNDYIVSIDVDCIMEKDSLLKLAKPFMQQEKEKVIATGGVVRIANSCVIEDGRLIEVQTPKKFLPRIQVIEYMRAFLLGRMAWAKLDGLLLISGALGMFDKKIAITVGGYDTTTVGEDMELIVRMRRYMIENKLPYTVRYIPDPLCWTEAPDNFAVLRKQRSRWTRGTMETLYKHRKMFFRPKYKLLGFLSMPYWFLFEYLAPVVELIGLIITIFFFAFGYLSPYFFLLLLLFVYLFAVMISTIALLTEENTYQRYSRLSDFYKLFFVALIEPIYFHPFTVYAALKGNWEKYRKSHAWGEMKRSGFNK